MRRHRYAKRVRRIAHAYLDRKAAEVTAIDANRVVNDGLRRGKSCLDSFRGMPEWILRSSCGRRADDY